MMVSTDFTTLSLLFAVIGSSMADLNKIVDAPNVICSQDGIKFDMETTLPFTGQLYVRNEFHNEKCRANFQQQNVSGTVKRGSFKLHFNDCGMRRQRMVAPARGMSYSVTMMVQFHSVFVTADDKAYEVRCFYREATTSVNANSISVSPLETEMMTLDHPMPKCTYTIKTQGLNGPSAKFVQVGDPVIHVFTCDNDFGTYRMLVKDCVVDDGKENTQQLITESGCSADETLFETPQYSGTKLLAFAEAKVFKWPDETAVYFSCQLTLCMNDDRECQITTPPLCSDPRKRLRRRLRRRAPTASNDTEAFIEEQQELEDSHEQHLVNFDLEVRRLIVLDANDVVDGTVTSDNKGNQALVLSTPEVPTMSTGSGKDDEAEPTMVIPPPTSSTTTTTTTTTSTSTTTTTTPRPLTTAEMTTTTVWQQPSTIVLPAPTPATEPPTRLATAPTLPVTVPQKNTPVHPNWRPSKMTEEIEATGYQSPPAVVGAVSAFGKVAELEPKGREQLDAILNKISSSYGKLTADNMRDSDNMDRQRLQATTMDGKKCYGQEYVIGFAIMLTLFCLILLALTLRLCYPYTRKAVEVAARRRRCFAWLGTDDAASSTSSTPSAFCRPPMPTAAMPTIGATPQCYMGPYATSNYYSS